MHGDALCRPRARSSITNTQWLRSLVASACCLICAFRHWSCFGPCEVVLHEAAEAAPSSLWWHVSAAGAGAVLAGVQTWQQLCLQELLAKHEDATLPADPWPPRLLMARKLSCQSCRAAGPRPHPCIMLPCRPQHSPAQTPCGPAAAGCSALPGCAAGPHGRLQLPRRRPGRCPMRPGSVSPSCSCGSTSC